MRKHAEEETTRQIGRNSSSDARSPLSTGYIRDQGSDLRTMRADEDLVEGINMRGVIWRWQMRRRRR